MISQAEDARMGVQQLLDALCMIASRKFADASSRVAGTQFLMESYVLPYAHFDEPRDDWRPRMYQCLENSNMRAQNNGYKAPRRVNLFGLME